MYVNQHLKLKEVWPWKKEAQLERKGRGLVKPRLERQTVSVSQQLKLREV